MPVRRLEINPPLPVIGPTSYQVDPESVKKMLSESAPNQVVKITQEQYNSAIDNYLSTAMKNDDFAFSVSDECSSHDASDWETYFKKTALTSPSIQQDLATTAPDSVDGNVYYQCFNSARITSVTNNGTDYLNNLIVKASFYKSELQSNFQGNDQAARVNDLDSYVNKLVDDFSKETADKIYKKLKADNANTSLTVDQLQANIKDIFQENSATMQKIISDKSDKWQTVLTTGGDYLNYFRTQLENATNNSDSEASSTDKMTYSDLQDLITEATSADKNAPVAKKQSYTPPIYCRDKLDTTSIILNAYAPNYSNDKPVMIYITA